MSDPAAAGPRVGATAWRRRRARDQVPRRNRVVVRYSDAEHAAMLANAAAARLAPAAYIAAVSTSTPGRVAAPQPAAGYRADLLLELMGLHRQMRGAATNLNQAVAKLNALGEPVGALPALAKRVHRIAAAVDAAVARVAAERQR